MRSLLAALRFLTIVPIPGNWGTAEDDIAGSVPWFPVIGLLLGGVAAGLAWGLSGVAPPMALAAVMVVVLLSFSDWPTRPTASSVPAPASEFWRS
jgi:adenosylcobinamide-GDP ribazoletransferase